jgi:hypothetical protein
VVDDYDIVLVNALSSDSAASIHACHVQQLLYMADAEHTTHLA